MNSERTLKTSWDGEGGGLYMEENQQVRYIFALPLGGGMRRKGLWVTSDPTELLAKVN